MITLSLQNTLKALSDPTRREILSMLKKGRLSAGEIVEKFPVSGAAVSRHLSVLKEADLIRDERDGKYIYYELNASVLEEIMLWVKELKGANDNTKRGFTNIWRQEYVGVNVEALNMFEDGTEVTVEMIMAAGLAKKVTAGVKILGDGKLEKKLTVKAHKFSKSAIEKIEAAGGKAEVI